MDQAIRFETKEESNEIGFRKRWPERVMSGYSSFFSFVKNFSILQKTNHTQTDEKIIWFLFIPMILKFNYSMA